MTSQIIIDEQNLIRSADTEGSRTINIRWRSIDDPSSIFFILWCILFFSHSIFLKFKFILRISFMDLIWTTWKENEIHFHSRNHHVCIALKTMRELMLLSFVSHVFVRSDCQKNLCMDFMNFIRILAEDSVTNVRYNNIWWLMKSVKWVNEKVKILQCEEEWFDIYRATRRERLKEYDKSHRGKSMKFLVQNKLMKIVFHSRQNYEINQDIKDKYNHSKSFVEIYVGKYDEHVIYLMTANWYDSNQIKKDWIRDDSYSVDSRQNKFRSIIERLLV